MRSYYVYILRCRDGSYYTGVTNDYKMRVYQHQSGVDTSCYTYKRRPVKLVYLAEFGDINEAIAWEKQVKKWSRRKKEALINSQYEDLPTLSRNGIERAILSIQDQTKHVMVSTVEP
ncbi:hypothetical protein A2454_01005 [Candidatus Peribacteria bacterium RIFOXYC2_FULL_55_14]|nr:MAG: hypothetical protein A2198_02710 [Candidatus Peribacteria bacterium RIFOXYA1_FULL_56_14]OGJ74716.1 MAG: hypothetical protein A2217_00030 [Candidatus Peribacteria bacterium RIFOXYA2_FULL_55_28]OGJ75653.1 MAG: hypothetical protein A2384_02135 [Candidatus Peribacteria bacterium RIFOXYB1_FULL_54_35]OGJ77716.1 MAG: hypothetical protein A2327_04840 [Candidatus Peribacteria bacterium RIFOXYB2_FULL_54_17]OGJ79222.1 MAG: hypothetical protein A2424_04180 [Candidatus Peribacteria bacterium RIFOXYC